MSLTPASAFIIGWTFCFAGTLPFGPVNLSVVDTTINRSFRAGLWLATAAAMVEIVQSLIALHSGPWISRALHSNPWIKAGSFVVFVSLGTAFLLRKSPGEQQEDVHPRRQTPFLKGLLIALVNPQSVPFWVFVITYLETSRRVHLDTHQHVDILFSFLAGVSLGKLTALLLFALLSRHISRRAGRLNHWMNKIIGGLLIGIGLFQGMKALLA